MGAKPSKQNVHAAGRRAAQVNHYQTHTLPPALSQTVLGAHVREYKLNNPTMRHTLGPLPFVDSELLSRPDAGGIVPPLGGDGGASDYRVSGQAPCVGAMPWGVGGYGAPTAQAEWRGASVSSGLRHIERQA